MILRGALALLVSPVLAAATLGAVSVVSPSAVLAVDISLDDDGRVLYSVARQGRQVIAPSQLGFLLSDAPKLDRNFALVSQSTRSSDDTWEQLWWGMYLATQSWDEGSDRIAATATP